MQRTKQHRDAQFTDALEHALAAMAEMLGLAKGVLLGVPSQDPETLDPQSLTWRMATRLQAIANLTNELIPLASTGRGVAAEDALTNRVGAGALALMSSTRADVQAVDRLLADVAQLKVPLMFGALESGGRPVVDAMLEVVKTELEAFEAGLGGVQ